MKTIIKFLLIISGIYALMIMSVVNVQAQFTAASVADMSYSTSTSVINTGIDNLEESGVTYELSAWDGNTPNCGYFVDDGNNTVSGDFGLYYTDAQDPDVSLMIRYCSDTKIFGVIVYYSETAQGFVWELGSFNPSTYVYSRISALVFDPMTTYGTTVNIDKNDINDFVITYDDPSQNIYYVTGYMDCSSTFQPRLDISGCTPVQINTTWNGSMPDVTVYYNSNSTMERVIFTFVDDASGDLMVEDESYADLSNCTPQSSPVSIATNAGYGFYYPRISSASGAAGWDTPWTVVVEENDGSTTYKIDGFTNTYPGGPSYIIPHVYNDGNTTDHSPLDLYLVSTAPNLRPVVAYSDALGDALFVGWTFYNYHAPNGWQSGSGETNADYPIVPGRADYDGYLDPQATYWEAPDPVNSNDHYRTLSMACAYNLSLAYYNGNDNKVYVKRVYPNASSLRLSTSADVYFNLFPNPSVDGQFIIDGITSPANIEVKNILGELIYRQNVSAPRAKINLGKQAAGIYFLTLKDEKQTINGKLLISR